MNAPAEPRDPPEERRPGGAMAYLELVRLPNLFTAAADVVMGFLFTHPKVVGPDRTVFALLAGASVSLYAGGVALNDYFDRQADAQERPERPIPSGRVPPAIARALGFGLLALGVALGLAAAAVSGLPAPAAVAAGLAGCIVLYDTVLKRTPLGPLAMGACRALNVLLGMSALGGAWLSPHWLIAAAVGVYVTGVTWFARSETGEPSRPQLAGATLTVLAGMGLLLLLPQWVEEQMFVRHVDNETWYLLLGIFAALSGLRCFQAVVSHDPERVGLTVQHLILTLVVLDMSACLAGRGVVGALSVALLLPPAVVLSRWSPTT